MELFCATWQNLELFCATGQNYAPAVALACLRGNGGTYSYYTHSAIDNDRHIAPTTAYARQPAQGKGLL